jgi:hypothetical protein
MMCAPVRFLSLNDELLTRKEVCAVMKWSASTLWRREQEGLPMQMGRIAISKLGWWVEQYDAARKAGLPARVFLKLPRRKRELLLAQCHVKRLAERICKEMNGKNGRGLAAAVKFIAHEHHN